MTTDRVASLRFAVTHAVTPVSCELGEAEIRAVERARASNLSALFASARPMSPMASSSSWDRTGRQWVASAAPALAWAGVGVPFDVVSNS